MLRLGNVAIFVRHAEFLGALGALAAPALDGELSDAANRLAHQQARDLGAATDDPMDETCIQM